MPDDFATVGDLEARWRPLVDAEFDVAETLLGDASQMVRERWPDVDARIAEGSLSALTLTRIVCAMVKRAMLAPDVDGVAQQSLSALQFGMSRTFSNPNGNLYFTAADIAAVDGAAGSARARMGWLL